jgi:hypothetical protein
MMPPPDSLTYSRCTDALAILSLAMSAVGKRSLCAVTKNALPLLHRYFCSSTSSHKPGPQKLGHSGRVWPSVNCAGVLRTLHQWMTVAALTDFESATVTERLAQVVL